MLPCPLDPLTLLWPTLSSPQTFHAIRYLPFGTGFPGDALCRVFLARSPKLSSEFIQLTPVNKSWTAPLYIEAVV